MWIVKGNFIFVTLIHVCCTMYWDRKFKFGLLELGCQYIPVDSCHNKGHSELFLIYLFFMFCITELLPSKLVQMMVFHFLVQEAITSNVLGRLIFHILNFCFLYVIFCCTCTRITCFVNLSVP